MGLVDMLGTDLNGLEFDLLPAGPGGNVQYASSFQLDGSASAHDRLLYSIADTGSLNFFFWGHGFRTGLGEMYPPDAWLRLHATRKIQSAAAARLSTTIAAPNRSAAARSHLVP